MYIFLIANQNFFISSFLIVPRFCVIAIFFLSSSKNMFELKEFPLYAGGVAAGVVVRSFERFVYPIFDENTQKSE